MFDPIQSWWHWVTTSTPLTGGWITVACLLVAVPVGFRQTYAARKRDKEKIRRSGRPRGLRGKDWTP